jgi:hypothetical protein
MQRTGDLVDECNTLSEDGMDFPMIWNSYLRGHQLVLGPPVQGYRNDQPVLCIPLFHHQTLIFAAFEPKFTIE